MPGVVRIARRYAVSVATAHKALHWVVAEGVLYRGPEGRDVDGDGPGISDSGVRHCQLGELPGGHCNHWDNGDGSCCACGRQSWRAPGLDMLAVRRGSVHQQTCPNARVPRPAGALPDDLLTAALDDLWLAAVDVALAEGALSDKAFERCRQKAITAARMKVMGLRPNAKHPALGAAAGTAVDCEWCGRDSSAPAHLSDAGVDLRRVVVGAVVLLAGPDGYPVPGLVARMDTLTFGVVDVDAVEGDPPVRVMFSAVNVVDVFTVKPADRISVWAGCASATCPQAHQVDDLLVRRHELPDNHPVVAMMRRAQAAVAAAGHFIERHEADRPALGFGG